MSEDKITGVCGNEEITFDDSPDIVHHILYSANQKPYFEVVATFLPGATLTINGLPRAEEDIKWASSCWGIDIRLVSYNDFSGGDQTVVDSRITDSDLQCDSGSTLSKNEDFKKFFREYIIPDEPTPPTRIYILYIGSDVFPNKQTIGCAHHNFSLNNYRYQIIIISDDAAKSWNKSACAHELGHIFFGTVPQQSNDDPTSNKNHPNAHSPNSNNVMYSPSGENQIITDEQRSKALKSRLIRR